LYQGLYIVLSFSIKHILYTIVFSKNVSLQLKIQFHIGSIGGSFGSNKDIFIFRSDYCAGIRIFNTWNSICFDR
jgi:hypothetical protein